LEEIDTEERSVALLGWICLVTLCDVDLGLEDLSEERILCCLVVNLKVVDLCFNFELLLLGSEIHH